MTPTYIAISILLGLVAMCYWIDRIDKSSPDNDQLPTRSDNN